MAALRRRRPPVDPFPRGQVVASSQVSGGVIQVSGVEGDVTIHAGAPLEVSWPVRVGVVPWLAHCYQARPETNLLERAVEPGATAVVTLVLTGLGGVGKSQLAAAYARSRQGELDVLVWVNASSRDAILAAYTQVAAKLGYSVAGVGATAEAGADWFLSWLQSTTDRPWLVVLDDLADPRDLRGLWPTGPAGSAVVTTRRTDAALDGHGRRRIPVGLFTPAAARSYLAAKLEADLDSAKMTEADELAADLGYLPLALAQAAAFILDRASAGETCAGYRARLADRRRALTELFTPDALADDYHATSPEQATVAATWSISIEAADRLPPAGAARALLEILAVLDPNGVPTEIFDTTVLRRYLQGRDGPSLAAGVTGAPAKIGLAEDPTPQVLHARDCRDTLANLARFSLITIDPCGGPGAVGVHALVQRSTLDHLASDQIAVLARAVADGLVAIWPEIERDPQWGQVLRANAAALADRHLEALLKPERHPLLGRAGWSLCEAGLGSAAVGYWTRIVHIADRELGPDHPQTLTARADLEYVRRETGDPVGAAARIEPVLADLVRVLGPDHIETLTIRANAAYWRGEAGDPAGAVSAFEELVADHRRVLGPDHPHTLLTRNHLACWRGEAGDPAGAVSAFEELVADHRRVLGPDHNKTLSARGNLACWRGEAGDPAGAVSALEALADDYLRALGSDHPDTLTTRGNLANRRGEAGDPAGAAASTEALLADRVRVLGSDHPNTLTTRANLARWRGEAGDPAGAVSAFEELVADHRRVLGPDHPQTLSARHSIAFWRGEAGDPARAAVSAKALLTDCVRALGPDHALTLAARANADYWCGARPADCSPLAWFGAGTV